MSNSQFPIQLDSIKRVQDFPQSQAINVRRYNELKIKSNLTTDEQSELNNLKITLDSYIITSTDFNLMASAIESTQQFTKDNVDGYLTSKQIEFQGIIDTKENDFTGIINTKENEFTATINQFADKGAYDNNVTYYKWNAVTYNSETFLSKHDDNKGNTPIGTTGDTHWVKIAQRGAQGIPGIGLVFVSEYNNSVTYQPQHAVRYEGAIYYCIAATTGNVPTNTTYWTLFLESNGIVINNSPPANPAVNPVWIDTSV